MCRSKTATISTALSRRFDAVHKQRYGHTMTDPVQTRARARARHRPHAAARAAHDPTRVAGAPTPRANRKAFCFAHRAMVDFAVYDRDDLREGDVVPGPAIVEEPTTTLVFFSDQSASVDKYGHLFITETKRIMNPRNAATDPATAEVIRHYLASAATEMERTLVRTAYSTIIYEINDFGLSIFDRNLNLLADATGLPLFLGANEYAIRQALSNSKCGPLEPGDVIFMNVPYWSGAHTNDGVLVAPVFVDGAIAAYTVVRAHWTDMGGKDPGYILDSTTVHQEGIMIPGEKIVRRGEPNRNCCASSAPIRARRKR